MIEKIKKLLQLADTSKNTNLEEAAAAAAKAQKLMEKHRIHKAMLEESNFSVVTHFLIDGGKPENWKVYLASILSKHNGCYIVKSDNYVNDNKIAIVGTPEDTQSIQCLYTFIASELIRLCLIELIGVKTKLNINPSASYISSFYIGAVTSVDKRLEDAKLEARNQEFKKAFLPEEKQEVVSALERIDTRTDRVKDWLKTNLNVEVKSIAISGGNAQGFNAGSQAASQIDLTPNSRKLGHDKKI